MNPINDKNINTKDEIYNIAKNGSKIAFYLIIVMLAFEIILIVFSGFDIKKITEHFQFIFYNIIIITAIFVIVLSIASLIKIIKKTSDLPNRKEIEKSCQDLLLEKGKEVEGKFKISALSSHENISRSVFRHLLLRNSQLDLLIAHAKDSFKDHPISEKIKGVDDLKKKEYKDLLAYKHAITDLFVEKALEYLDVQAKRYTRLGKIVYLLGILTVIIGLLFSAFTYLDQYSGIILKEWGIKKENRQILFSIDIVPTYLPNTLIILDSLQSGNRKHIEIKRSSFLDSLNNQIIANKIKDEKQEPIIELISHFSKAFTFYGFIVIIAVGLWRLGRALLDQAERLHEKRHSLRQGRLFVHLQNGEMKIDDLLKSFDWNVSKTNAFGEMKTDAKAPWGAAINDLSKLVDIALKPIIEKLNGIQDQMKAIIIPKNIER